jgi:hypothetical protein
VRVVVRDEDRGWTRLRFEFEIHSAKVKTEQVRKTFALTNDASAGPQ